MLQWAVGGLLFGWITTRRREVGLGYGWLIRGVFGSIALLAAAVSLLVDTNAVEVTTGLVVAAASTVALASSIKRRRAGVREQHAVQNRRSARVAAMTGIERDVPTHDSSALEFDPRLDLVAPALGAVGLVGIAGADAVEIIRIVVGGAFVGAVTDAMLLGHWYLVQPGLRRDSLLELVAWAGALWPLEVAAFLLSPSMLAVLSGSIDDDYGGLLGWVWLTSAVTTIVLLAVTRAALRERYYSAVMAATGLLYLAMLTAFGTDLIARAVLA